MMELVIRFLLLIGRVYSYLLLASAVLSWFPGLNQSRLVAFLDFLVEPILNPLRRFGLQVGGLDFTVFVAMLGIEFLQHLLLRLFF